MLVSMDGYEGYYDPGEDRSKIVYGQGSISSLPAEIADKRAVLVTSKAIQDKTDLIGRLTDLLGSQLVGVFTGSVLHTPRKAILEAAAFARPLQPDVILSLGGGSDTDTCKALRLVLWLELNSEAEFDDAFAAYKRGWNDWGGSDLGRRLLPQIGMPTTLISAEHTQGVGVTDETTHAKQVFSHPDLRSEVIILDPDLSMTTPPQLWYSTGVKALEHAIAKLSARDRDPVLEAIAAHSVAILGQELPRSHKNHANPIPRGNLLIASWLCMFGSWNSLVKRMGLSHALGRQVGGVSGASHGLISAVLLPLCMEFNAPACGDAIGMAAGGLRIQTDGLSTEASALQAAAKVRDLIHELGLPQRLRDIGVREDDLSRIAEKTMGDMSVATNPRSIRDASQVLELLQRAW